MLSHSRKSQSPKEELYDRTCGHSREAKNDRGNGSIGLNIQKQTSLSSQPLISCWCFPLAEPTKNPEDKVIQDEMAHSGQHPRAQKREKNREE